MISFGLTLLAAVNDKQYCLSQNYRLNSSASGPLFYQRDYDHSTDFLIRIGESGIQCINSNVEVVKSFSGNPVKFFMKGDYVSIAITVVFPVVVDTIQPHVHQDIDKRFSIFVFITLFLRYQSCISGITASGSPTFENLIPLKISVPCL